MSENRANSKRIAKNTLVLYFRMILMMCVTLYTSRVVLNALGVEDFGIYNVVGGVVAIFTMISSSLSSAISRFITFELGRKGQEEQEEQKEQEVNQRLNTIFSTSIIIQLIISAIIILLVETIGLWFLTSHMVIPVDRLVAAKWVLQFSLITLVINMISIPYNALIIAHERMSAFAYISIIDAVSKLAIAYVIATATTDKLILYAVLMCLVSLLSRFIYGFYCRRHFDESRFRLIFDRELLREMFSFAGWNFVGIASGLVRDQGGNILINILGGGPVVNAARGVSVQVYNAVVGFSNNFMMALDPQITKSYANGNREYMMELIFKGSRYAFYMLLTLSLPIIVSTSYILELWLKNVPDYTTVFVRLALIFGICDAISRPAIIAIVATGNIKKCQIIVGIVQLLNLPISYLLLKVGYPPTSVLIVSIVLIIICLFVRLVVLRDLVGLSIRGFMGDVLLNALYVSALSCAVPAIASRYVPNDNFWGFVVISAICVVSTLLVVYLIGIKTQERSFVNQKILEVARKFGIR